MSRVFAEFEEFAIDQDTIVRVRRNTRLYCVDQPNIEPSYGRCIGAFYLINPGSAAPMCEACGSEAGRMKWKWGPVDYSREQLMPVLLGVIDDALNMARASNSESPRLLRADGYVQLLNLSYIQSAKDGKTAITQWRPLVADSLVADDCPRSSELMQFVVFGWGKSYYHHKRDGERVASTLAACVAPNATFLFPAASAVRNQHPLDVVTIASPTAEAIHAELNRANNYPCGAQSERKTYPQLYRQAVAPVLARLLA